ncbi:reverse transcriptase domain-containing protein [Tanacetum coccineum]
MKEVVKKEIIKLLDAGIIYAIEDSPWVSPVHCVPKKGGMTVVTNEDNELVPTRTPIRKRPLSLALMEPTPTSVCPLHQQLFEDVNSCKQAHLVLNWEKCHFMVTEGIVLGHKVSSKGLEVDKAKIDVIAKLPPPPTNVKGVRSVLGHAGFYRRFIKDFFTISRPMTKLLKKDLVFNFDEECNKAFKTLKEKLKNTPIMVSPNWSLPFGLMCDASDYIIGAMLG